MNAADSIFHQVFCSIGGGKRIAVLINVCFDESSESDSQNGLLAVCGYALDLKGIDGLILDWREMLRVYRLPYFHMSECNTCTGIFEHLTDTECDKCAREAIRIARTHPLHGHSFALDQTEYRAILQDRGFDCDPYTFMVWSAFIHVNRWVHENRPDCKISLFFERAYKTQRRADELLNAIWQAPMRGRNRVASYGFVKKEDSEPTQAADLVAWHVRKAFENARNGKPIRKDYKAIVEDRKILSIEFTAQRLEGIRGEFTRKAGSLENAAKTIFSQIDQSAVGPLA